MWGLPVELHVMIMSSKKTFNFGSKLSKEEWQQKIRELGIPKCPHAKGEEWLCGQCSQDAIDKNNELQTSLMKEIELNEELKKEILENSNYFEAEIYFLKQEIRNNIGISEKMRMDIYSAGKCMQDLAYHGSSLVETFRSWLKPTEEFDDHNKDFVNKLVDLEHKFNEVAFHVLENIKSNFDRYDYSERHAEDNLAWRENERWDKQLHVNESEFWRVRNNVAEKLSLDSQKVLTDDDLQF